MELICMEGNAPGRISAAVAHRGEVRQLAMEIESHPAGGWRARHREGWGLRCHSVPAAILLEAAEAFAPELAIAAE